MGRLRMSLGTKGFFVMPLLLIICNLMKLNSRFGLESLKLNVWQYY